MTAVVSWLLCPRLVVVLKVRVGLMLPGTLLMGNVLAGLVELMEVGWRAELVASICPFWSMRNCGT